ncbi:type III-B CRISPR-associated protein Cas10/Cmr2 [Bacteroidia bacterium]|nr:type III-B CRISPR-associated protein Cas10/Cmr2 [Bacteroidia bacterium]
MKKNKYLGITIGPIYDTILQAQKTREFWFGSYFFSHLMKLILREIINKGYGTILAQDTSKIHEDEKLHGAGIYSDRCYVRLSKDFTQENYDSLSESVLNQLKVEDKSVLKDYVQIYCTVQTIDGDGNYIQILNQQLDTMELQTQYSPWYIYTLASGYENLKKLRRNDEKIILPTNVDGLITEWYELGFNKADRDDLIYYENINGGIWSFPSLLEITTKGLDRFNSDLYKKEIHSLFEKSLSDEINGREDKTKEKEILKQIKKLFPDYYQTAHKYAVIVTADGDNMGKLFKAVAEKHDDDLLNKLAQNVSEFNRQASRLIYQYGGKPVYIGGDDLVFFAPSISYEDETKVRTNSEIEGILWSEDNSGHIFNLIEALDNVFNHIFATWIDNPKYEKPSLSYGISITYYKYPLSEAMNLSHDLLFNHAKKYPTEKNPVKNCIAVQLMMHSGSFDEVVLEKSGSDSSFNRLLELLKKFPEKENVINSILQRLRSDAELILCIGRDEDSFKSYFSNEYEFQLMTNTRKKAFIEHSIELFKKIFEQQKGSPEKALKQLCTMYRLLNFLIHKETENEDEI